MTTAEVTTVIGQLSIQGGTWRSTPPNQVAVREPKAADAPGAGKGDLFILAEIHGEVSDRDTAERQLVEAIRDAYYLARGSLTASLRRALQTAGEQLYQRNSRVAVDKRVIAGVVALVIHQDDAFIARIGPSTFFTVLGQAVQRYPARSPWLDDIGPVPSSPDIAPPDESALGISPIIEPDIHHFRVESGDTLVLADSRLAGQLLPEEVTRAVATPAIKTAIKNLGKAAGVSDGSALILAVIPETQPVFKAFKAAAPAQLNRLWPGRHGQPASPAPAEPEEALAEPVPLPVEEMEEAEPEAVFASTRSMPEVRTTGRKAARQPGPPSEEERPEPKPGRKPPAERTARSHDPAEEDRDSSEGKARRPARPERSTSSKRVMASTAKADAPWRGQPTHSAGTASPGSWRAGLGFLGGLTAILRRTLPDTDDSTRPQAGIQAYRRPSSPVSWTMLRNIAIVLPLLIALVVGVSYLQKGRQREAEYTELVQGAQAKVEQAQAVDSNAARGLMSEAEALLVKAEQIKPNQPEIADLRTKMAAQNDSIGKVQRLYYLPQLRQYTDPGTNLKSIVVQGVEIYVLDTGTDRVFHHRLDDMGETLLPDAESLLVVSRGQSVEDTPVDELVDMTWMPVGGNRQTSDLLILSNSGLLEYNPSWGITTAAIAAPAVVTAPVSISSFFGNLYVLDAQASRLWRYLPTADGYSNSPESYFPPEQLINLNNAVDMAIDGAIYVLYKDGRVGKYTGGQPVDFNLSGLDQPLNNPVAIFTAPDEAVQHIYVADAGNRRIVQFGKDGSFIRQFQPRPGEAVSFANLQDIFVDEISGRLYVLDSNNLYVGNIPEQE